MLKKKDPLALIEEMYTKFSKTGKKVGDYVRLHPEKTILASLQAVSKKCSVSDASVLRFCRSLGFSGYQDFKAALVPVLLKRGAPIHQEIDISDSFISIREKFIENLTNDIRNTITSHTEKLVNQVADRIAQSRTIVILGLAGSAGIARIFNDCLLGLGIYSSYLSDRVEIERVVSQLNSDNTIVGISHSGETQEIVYAIKRSKENSVFTVGLTNFSSSSVARLCDLSLLTSVPETLLGSYSCQPRIVQLAVLELITIEISKKIE